METDPEFVLLGTRDEGEISEDPVVPYTMQFKKVSAGMVKFIKCLGSAFRPVHIFYFIL
jgi:hypothetical protein